MSEHIIMDEVALHRCIVRLSHEIEERCEGLENVVLLGMKAGGGAVARRIADYFARSQDTLVPCAIRAKRRSRAWKRSSVWGGLRAFSCSCSSTAAGANFP